MSIAYGFVFLILAACAGAVAALGSWAIRVPAACSAVSLLVVAVAYFGAGPRLLFKRANGRRFGWGWAVHWPYFALTTISYRLAIGFSREAAFVQVAPNVFLGRRLTQAEARRIEVWPAVLDLAAELTDPPLFRAVSQYRSLPLLDATAPTLEQLRDAVAWVQWHAAAGPVYVHCALGHSRSATVVAAYLLAAGLAPDARSALRHLRGLRPGVRPNRAQRRALNQFAAGLATSEP